jgi:hypothetical protein
VTVAADGELAAAVAHGRVMARDELPADGDGPWPLVDPVGALLAVYELHGHARVKPSVVLASQSDPAAG